MAEAAFAQPAQWDFSDTVEYVYRDRGSCRPRAAYHNPSSPPPLCHSTPTPAGRPAAGAQSETGGGGVTRPTMPSLHPRMGLPGSASVLTRTLRPQDLPTRHIPGIRPGMRLSRWKLVQ